MVMSKRKRRLTIIRDLLLVSMIVPALFVFSFGSSLLQEKDTFAIIVTAVLVKGIQESAGFNAAMVAVKLAEVFFVILVGAFYINPDNQMAYRIEAQLAQVPGAKMTIDLKK